MREIFVYDTHHLTTSDWILPKLNASFFVNVFYPLFLPVSSLYTVDLVFGEWDGKKNVIFKCIIIFLPAFMVSISIWLAGKKIPLPSNCVARANYLQHFHWIKPVYRPHNYSNTYEYLPEAAVAASQMFFAVFFVHEIFLFIICIYQNIQSISCSEK